MEISSASDTFYSIVSETLSQKKSHVLALCLISKISQLVRVAGKSFMNLSRTNRSSHVLFVVTESRHLKHLFYEFCCLSYSQSPCLAIFLGRCM